MSNQLTFNSNTIVSNFEAEKIEFNFPAETMLSTFHIKPIVFDYKAESVDFEFVAPDLVVVFNAN